MSQSIGATDTGGERVASYACPREAERAVDQLAIDPELISSVWVEVSEKGTRNGSGCEAIAPRALVAAVGVGTLIGIAFLILTLVGLPILAWAVLGSAMILALTDTALVAVGASGLVAFGSTRGGIRNRTCTYDVVAKPAVAGEVMQVLATPPHPPSG